MKPFGLLDTRLLEGAGAGGIATQNGRTSAACSTSNVQLVLLPESSVCDHLGAWPVSLVSAGNRRS
jgi:hypothetical protein